MPLRMLSKTSNRLLAATFLLGMTASMSGCVSMPERPILEVCVLDTPRLECICGITDNPDVVTRHPIDYCDKATAMRPSEWEKYQNYVDELRDTLQRVIDRAKQ